MHPGARVENVSVENSQQIDWNRTRVLHNATTAAQRQNRVKARVTCRLRHYVLCMDAAPVTVGRIASACVPLNDRYA